ncbi:tetratricopeptide repeat protein [uncultured Psychrobacter sp.]|uniref:tetratricopeptide repeat protein n=1 Tax=uncultured Psychrobacter sp. TaxID=259303 RepID=UPI002625B466|nr:tetratricopeptide repeat protein [uncultured Psychrobacter sp.]
MKNKKLSLIFVDIDSNYYDEIIRVCNYKFNLNKPIIFIKNKRFIECKFFLDKSNISNYLGLGETYSDLLDNLYIYRFLNRIIYKSNVIDTYDFIHYHNDETYLKNIRDNIVLDSYPAYILFAKLSRKVGDSKLTIDTLKKVKKIFPESIKSTQNIITYEINYNSQTKYDLLAYYLSDNPRSLKAEINKAFNKADYNIAIVLLKNYLKIFPSDYTELRKLGIAYYKSFDNENAFATLIKAKKIKKDYSTEYLIGIVLYNQMKFERAIDYIESAIKIHPAQTSLKKTVNAFFNNKFDFNSNKELFKNIQYKLGLPKIDKIVELANYQYMLSVCYLANGQKDKYIVTNYRIIKSLRPDFYKSYEAIFQFASEEEIEDLNSYISRCIKIIKISKVYDKSFDNNQRVTKYYQSMLLLKARFLILQGNKEESGKLFLEAYDTLPHHKALKWLGYYNLWSQNYSDAILFYSQYLQIKPKDIDAKLNLARSYLESGNYDSADSIVESSLDVLVDSVNIDKSHLVRRNLEYSKGNLGKAWRIFSERNISKCLKNNLKIHYNPSLSKLNPNSNLLILAEWGPGDEIRWSSIYSDLEKNFSNITITCEPRLFSLFNRTWKNINFIPVHRRIRGIVNSEILKKIDEIPNTLLTQVVDNNIYRDIDNFDQVCLMSDVLAEFRQSTYNFINSHNSNVIDICPIRSKIWKNWLSKLDKNINIGICWKSGLTDFTRNVHYTEIEMWGDVFRLKGINFINLQYAGYEKDIDFVKEKYGVTIHNPKGLDLKNDFEGLAALIANLDLIISPATVIAEFAGLVGAPTLLTSNSREIDWRVLMDGSDLWFKDVKHIRADRDVSNYEAQKSIISKIRSYILDIKKD